MDLSGYNSNQNQVRAVVVVKIIGIEAPLSVPFTDFEAANRFALMTAGSCLRIKNQEDGSVSIYPAHRIAQILVKPVEVVEEDMTYAGRN